MKKTKAKEKKIEKKTKKVGKDEDNEDSEGLSLDDAFGDFDDIEYGKSKPFKAKKKDINEDGMEENELEEELDVVEKQLNGKEERREITIKASKPISKIKKGDKIKIDGNEYEVDSHYVLMDHKTTKEMAIELFDSKNDKDYQLRYFDDQAEATLEFYELQEIMYFKKNVVKIEW